MMMQNQDQVQIDYVLQVDWASITQMENERCLENKFLLTAQNGPSRLNYILL